MLKDFSSFIRKAIGPLFTTNTYRGELGGLSNTSSGLVVTPEAALTVSAVAACVRILSETIAALPVHVYRDLGNSKTIEIDHPVYDLLHSRPNEFQTNYTFYQQAIAHLLLHGNSYAFIERNSGGTAVALWPLRPEGVVVEIKQGTLRYRYSYGGVREEYSFRDVLHFKGPSLDGLVGMSIVHMAREGIGLAMAQDRHGSNLFRNNARPGLVLQNPGLLSKDAQDRLRDSVGEGYSGKNGYKTMVLEQGMTIAPYGFSSEDAQFLESRQFSVIEIARWFRVPPTMIGDMTRVSYSSSESELQLFAMHSLAPLCSNLEAEMNMKLFPDRTQFLARFDVNSMIRGDQSSRYAAYGQGLASGFLTVADVRSAEDLPFIPGTDKLNRPANMMPHEGGPSGNLDTNVGDKVAG